MSDEDKRTAVGITITLSSQLILAALTMLTIESAYAAFVLNDRIVSWWFILVVSASAVAFVASIFIAGKAMTSSRDSGYNGAWRLDTGKNQFNWQAILSLVGLVLFGLSIRLTGVSKDTIMTKSLSDLEARVKVIEYRLDDMDTSQDSIQHDIESLDLRVAQIEHSLNLLQTAVYSQAQQRPECEATQPP